MGTSLVEAKGEEEEVQFVDDIIRNKNVPKIGALKLEQMESQGDIEMVEIEVNKTSKIEITYLQFFKKI